MRYFSPRGGGFFARTSCPTPTSLVHKQTAMGPLELLDQTSRFTSGTVAGVEYCHPHMTTSELLPSDRSKTLVGERRSSCFFSRATKYWEMPLSCGGRGQTMKAQCRYLQSRLGFQSWFLLVSREWRVVGKGGGGGEES